MAQGSTHSPGEQEIFVPGGKEGDGVGGAIDSNTTRADGLFIMLCNMQQKN